VVRVQLAGAQLHALTAALAALALTAAPASAAGGTCAKADQPLASMSAGEAEAVVLCVTNAERAARGLGTLKRDPRLARTARDHSDDMARRGYFDHTSPDGRTAEDRVNASGYRWSAYGENLAMGYGTAQEAVAGWVASPAHCRNLLSPAFTELGVGAHVGKALLTQVFGRPANRDEPLGPVPACEHATPRSVDAGADPATAAGAGSGAQDVQGASVPGAAPVVPVTATIARARGGVLVQATNTLGRATTLRVRFTGRGPAQMATLRLAARSRKSWRILAPRGRRALTVTVSRRTGSGWAAVAKRRIR
jgi:uncharacterized protein YkwD